MQPTRRMHIILLPLQANEDHWETAAPKITAADLSSGSGTDLHRLQYGEVEILYCLIVYLFFVQTQETMKLTSLP